MMSMMNTYRQPGMPQQMAMPQQQMMQPQFMYQQAPYMMPQQQMAPQPQQQMVQPQVQQQDPPEDPTITILSQILDRLDRIEAKIGNRYNKPNQPQKKEVIDNV